MSFRCRSNYYCSCEVYAYDVERLPNGAGLRWRCPCGTFRALSPQQVSDMRKQLVDDAAAPDGTR